MHSYPNTYGVIWLNVVACRVDISVPGSQIAQAHFVLFLDVPTALVFVFNLPLVAMRDGSALWQCRSI